MNKLYAEYIKERENLELIQSEYGFISYRFEKDHLFIANIFVTKDKRKSGEAKKLVEELYTINNKNKIICAVCTEANNWQESKRFIEYMGYRELYREYTLIFMIKEK